jgi:carboxylesterase type B
MCRVRDLLKQAEAQGSNAWWYLFTATPIYSVNMGEIPTMGSFHGAEVPFVFGDGFELMSEGERTLSKQMGCYWTNFAATGDPNRGSDGCAAALQLPQWPPLNDQLAAIVFSNTSVTSVAGLMQRQCDLFARYP